jgi:hypothetical protein
MSNITKRPVVVKGAKRKRKKVSDEKYCKWLREQPSALSGHTPCVPAHFRSAANSGTGTKPAYSAIPLRFDEHNTQHRVGTFAFMPRAWWIEKVKWHQQAFIAQGGFIPEEYKL